MRRLEIPYLPTEQIWEKADAFRARYGDPDDHPVDVDLLIEKSGIAIVPIAGLVSAGVEGCLDASLDKIYVDRDSMENPHKEFRYRFTIAHEMGHVILHRNVYEQYAEEKPKSVFDWANIVQSLKLEHVTRFEYTANEFAGRLLVPQKALISRVSGIELPDDPALRSIPHQEVLDYKRDHVARQIHRKFQVNVDVIKLRLQREGIPL